VRASGAGAATQHSVGTGIMCGMLASILIGVFFTPVFYVLVMKLSANSGMPAPRSEEPH
jgi:hypothetical protein